jgi:hypothetical protein
LGLRYELLEVFGEVVGVWFSGLDALDGVVLKERFGIERGTASFIPMAEAFLTRQERATSQ